jgi:hypothetical protein
MVAAAPFVLLPVGLLYWLRTGKRSSTRQLLLLWASAPGIILGLSGLVTGTASRGHVFVLVFTAIPAAIVLLALAPGLRRANERPLPPDVPAEPSGGPEGR